jgi:ATP-dependent Clp protease ATP-binding subunit ClpA
VIQREVETPLAKQIVEGKVLDNSRVIADLQKGRIVFQTESPPMGEAGAETARA